MAARNLEEIKKNTKGDYTYQGDNELLKLGILLRIADSLESIAVKLNDLRKQ